MLDTCSFFGRLSGTCSLYKIPYIRLLAEFGRPYSHCIHLILIWGVVGLLMLFEIFPRHLIIGQDMIIQLLLLPTTLIISSLHILMAIIEWMASVPLIQTSFFILLMAMMDQHMFQNLTDQLLQGRGCLRLVFVLSGDTDIMAFLSAHTDSILDLPTYPNIFEILAKLD